MNFISSLPKDFADDPDCPSGDDEDQVSHFWQDDADDKSNRQNETCAVTCTEKARDPEDRSDSHNSMNKVAEDVNNGCRKQDSNCNNSQSLLNPLQDIWSATGNMDKLGTAAKMLGLASKQITTPNVTSPDCKGTCNHRMATLQEVSEDDPILVTKHGVRCNHLAIICELSPSDIYWDGLEKS